MKLLVASDSHGDHDGLGRVLAQHADADALFFLGDGLYDLQRARRFFPGPIHAVRGNCDTSQNYENEGYVRLEGVRFFFTHGHGYEVKMSYAPLKKAARQKEAQVVLFGHTHTPYYEYDNGLHIFNPGALQGSRFMAGSYGILTLEEDRLHFQHVDMPF